MSFNFSLLLLCCHFGVFGVYKFVVRCSFGLCVELFSFIVFFSPSLSVRCRQQLQRRRRRRQRFCLFFFLLSVICALLHKYICIYCFFLSFILVFALYFASSPCCTHSQGLIDLLVSFTYSHSHRKLRM